MGEIITGKQESSKKGPTTSNRQLIQRIWCQALLFIEFSLEIDGSIIVLGSGFISFCFYKHIKTLIVLRYRKACIFPPQEPVEMLNRRIHVKTRFSHRKA